MVIFKLLYLSYMPTTLYFSYFHTYSIVMIYLVHKYKKNLGSKNMDLTHSKIVSLSTSHTIVPFTIGCKFRTFFGHTKSSIQKKEPYKTVYAI